MPTEEESLEKSLLEKFKKLNIDQKRILIQASQQQAQSNASSEAALPLTPQQPRKDSDSSSQDSKASDAPLELLSPDMQRGQGLGSSMNPNLMAATGDRPRTKIGPQGEHVSAYVLYEELIYSALDGGNVRDAAQRLSKVFKSLPLEQNALKELDKKIEEFQGVIAKSIPREERKAITRSLRRSNLLAEDAVKQKLIELAKNNLGSDPNQKDLLDKIFGGLDRLSVTADHTKVKEDIRLANRAKLAPLVSELMDICLLGANKMPFSSFPEEGCPKNVNTGKEKKAKNILKDFSNFIKTVSIAQKTITNTKEQEEKEQALEDIEKNKLQIKEKFGINEAKLEEIKSNGIDGIEEEHIQKISEHISNLFWHPYVDNPLTKDSAEWKSTQKKYNKDTEPRDNNPEILFQVAAKHLVLVFNCFEGLKSLNKFQQKTIEDNFLGDVLERQEWRKSGLNLGKISDGVTGRAILNYQNKEYCVKGSEAHTEVLSRDVAVRTR